jgi:hypothetical protein
MWKKVPQNAEKLPEKFEYTPSQPKQADYCVPQIRENARVFHHRLAKNHEVLISANNRTFNIHNIFHT